MCGPDLVASSWFRSAPTGGNNIDTTRIKVQSTKYKSQRPKAKDLFEEAHMDSLFKDLRFGIRALMKHYGFTAIAVLTLALGIGGSTAIFTAVNAALLRGLPYKKPNSLYHLFESTPQREYARREFSYPDYQDYQQNQVCEGIAAYSGGGGSILSGRGEPQRIAAPVASANFFSVLGVEPLFGRTFESGDDKPGGPKVTVLTYGAWQRL